MNKKPSKFGSFLKKTAVPFFTVFVIVFSSIALYVATERVTDDEKTVFFVMLVSVMMVAAVYTVCDIVRRKLVVEKPLYELLSATEKIAQGDFTVRLKINHPYGKYTDFDLIADNLNKMVLELQKSETLNSDFISNVSHEIKTPLSVIKNYAMLLKNENDKEKSKKYIDTIVQATDKLNGLVVNVLKLNKLENQQLLERREKFSLTDSVAESVLLFEDAFEKKNIELVCELEEVEIVSVKSCLELVWNNLLSNAVKFTPQGGTITVKLTGDKNKATVTVKDNGIGISAETGKRIFDKFYQADASRASEGNGLGLSLVKKVIDLLGGEISVKSELGRGSEFKVVLKGE